MTKYDDTAYAYAVGRVQAVERTLIDAGKLEQMISARSFDEAYRLLSEAGYDTSLPAEAALKNALDAAYALIADLAPEKKVMDVFLLKNDYHNLKVLIKQEFLRTDGVQYNDILIANGSMPVDDLAAAFVNRQFEKFHPIMRQAVDDAIAMMQTVGDPQQIDLILDRALYRQMAALADELQNEFVAGLVARMADTTNIRTYARVRRMGKDAAFLESALLPCGDLPASIFSESADGFAERLSTTRYAEIVADGIEIAPGILEKRCGRLLMDYAMEARYVSLGLEPLVGYLLKKEEEVKQVRVVLVGKQNGLDAAAIRERIGADG